MRSKTYTPTVERRGCPLGGSVRGARVATGLRPPLDRRRVPSGQDGAAGTRDQRVHRLSREEQIGMALSASETGKRAEAREAVLDAIIGSASSATAESLAQLAEAYKNIVSPSTPG
ncbi:MAG TPA: hypothetical protein VIM17_12865 [Jatrophihabitantaceae bacterium]